MSTRPDTGEALAARATAEQAHQTVQPLPPTAGFDLTKLHQILVERLRPGQAPSLITLRRHAKTELAPYLVTGTASKRPLYYWAKVTAHYEKRHAARASESAAPVQVAGYTDEQLERVLGNLLGPLINQLAEVTRAIASLPAVRSSLMMKYDAAAALSSRRADQAEEQLREARKSMDLERNVIRLTAAVGKLTEAVTAQGQPGQNG